MRVLLTGMSGVGKSTIIRELVERGFRAVDADDGWVVPMPDGTQRWDVPAVTRLLDEGAEPALFFAGCEDNMVELLPRFDCIILLSAPEHVMAQRLASRANPFGRRPDQRDRIFADLREFEPRLRAIADLEVVTTGRVEQALAQILRFLDLG